MREVQCVASRSGPVGLRNNQLLSLFVSPTASQTISHSFGRAIYYGSHMAGADESGIPVVRPALELADFASRPSNIK